MLAQATCVPSSRSRKTGQSAHGLLRIHHGTGLSALMTVEWVALERFVIAERIPKSSTGLPDQSKDLHLYSSQAFPFTFQANAKHPM